MDESQEFEPPAVSKPEITQEDPTSTETEKHRIFSWFLEKRNLLLKASPVVGLALLGASVLYLAQNEENTHESQDLPIATSTRTPQVADTPAIAPLKTPDTTSAVSSPAIETPTPVESQPNVPWANNFEQPILVDTLTGNETITVQDANAIINEIFRELPVVLHPTLGKLKIELKTSDDNQYNIETHTIELVLTSDNFQRSLIHELVHSWQELTKGDENFYNLKQQILADPEVGRDYPDIEKITSGNWLGAYSKLFSDEQMTLVEIQDASSQQSNHAWIEQKGSLPFSDLLASEIIDTNHENTIYPDFATFLASPKVQELSSTNQKWEFILSNMKQNPDAYDRLFRLINPNLNYELKEQELFTSLIQAGSLSLASFPTETINELFTPAEIAVAVETMKVRMLAPDEELLSAEIANYLDMQALGRLISKSQHIEDLISAIKIKATN